MDRADLKELHYITPMVNISSIGKLGILSHARAEAIDHASVALQEIQDLRAKVVVPQGRRLHEYANLYICGRNPMMYKRKEERDGLCVLRVSPEVLDLPNVIITDRNAAGLYVKFRPAPDGLEIVDQTLTFAEWWTDFDYYAYLRKKAAKCAEVLVPDVVDPQFVTGAYVAHATAAGRFEEINSGLEVKVDGHLFFI